LLIATRLPVLALFLTWRVTHNDMKHYGYGGCRSSASCGIDVFVSTADPDKAPVLVTANTILSILAADYPIEKLACYVSDDGGALVTLEAMVEAASFPSVVNTIWSHEIKNQKQLQLQERSLQEQNSPWFRQRPEVREERV
ncbi:hypothetical protein GW17_00061435, partial [Ensete ventricosum]